MKESDLTVLKEIKTLIQESQGKGLLSMEASLWLYDNVYLPVNNELAKYNKAKHDDGQLS